MLDRLEALLRTGHDSVQLRFGLATGYFRLADWVKAVEHASVAVNEDPDYSAAWRLLGKALVELGLVEEARGAFQNGLAAAKRRGDEQTAKELNVFLRRLDKDT